MLLLMVSLLNFTISLFSVDRAGLNQSRKRSGMRYLDFFAKVDILNGVPHEYRANIDRILEQSGTVQGLASQGRWENV